MGFHYYQSIAGILINSTVGFWTMFPPLFADASHRDMDRHSLDTLIGLCREGERTMVGIHPEGGRNLDPDPYSLRRVQPGTGRIIHEARPQVIPVFVVGLENTLWDQIAANWRSKTPIRIHFGPQVDLSSMYELPGKGSTYKTITDYVMDRVRDLMENDRAIFGEHYPTATESQQASA
jgi:1-acyl-sn-glycerol-3-phosphate acyltransferase